MDINKIYKSIIKNYLKIEDDNISELCQYKEPVKKLRNSYRSNICKSMYDTKVSRDSYMLAYFPYYSLLTSEVIKNIKKYINKTSKLNISIFGCGPSPEILGICNEIDCKRINYNLLDYEMGWDKQREFAKKYIRKNYMGQYNFEEISGCDLLVTCEDCKVCIKDIKDSDLFVMQNCLNHITNEDDFIKKISFIMEYCKRGAVFVFIDLNYNIVRKLLDKIYNENKEVCKKIDSESNGLIKINKDIINDEIKKYLFTGENDLILRKNVKYSYLALKKI